MNPTLYRIVGLNEDGNWRTIWTNRGWAFFLDRESAVRSLGQLNGGNGRWQRRYYSEFRIEESNAAWTPA